MAQSVLPSSSASYPFKDFHKSSATRSAIFNSKLRLLKTHFRLLNSFKKDILFMLTNIDANFEIDQKRSKLCLTLKASRGSSALTQEITIDKEKSLVGTHNGSDLFTEMKHRFLSFKKHKYLENLECFQNLAKGQVPKFMVIACADSRVCPSSILGFQPGEAFVIRNVANLVPSFENGPSETNAALEFAVNSLGVENILVIGHSCCGGIRALMSMEDEVNSSSFINSWVVVGKYARLSTKAAAASLSFDQQCRHCEKESINSSLLNLLTYPWIEERFTTGMLSIHGGYYDFVDCTFEKWTLDFQGNCSKTQKDGYAIRNREFWC